MFEHALLLLTLALCAIVGIKLITFDIDLTGLLAMEQGGDIDPARVQALIVTVTAAFLYLGMTFQNFKTGYFQLPDIPDVYAFGVFGSQTLYLFRKYLHHQI